MPRKKRTMETWTQSSVSREEDTEKVATEMLFWMEGMRKRIIQQINKQKKQKQKKKPNPDIARK